MRSVAGLLLLLCLLPGFLQAQHTRTRMLRGVVIDAASHQTIESATVSAYHTADTALIGYALTNRKGEFLIRGIPLVSPCRIVVSFSGYNSVTRELMLSEGARDHIMDTIRMNASYTQLEDVVVSARRPPVLIRKDTIEYDAAAFKTPANGVMEDLVKLLPGLEVDDAGNITYNGKRIVKITVDGKDFFGNDFKIASKNLPRDIIDKVQVVTHRSQEARFNNITTGKEEKAINITLKKDKKRGVFGRISTGFGTDNRFETGASLNYMNKSTRLNFIGNANNINRTTLTEGDLTTGRPDGNFGAGAPGITTTKGAGLNWGKEFSSRIRLNGSYFYDDRTIVNDLVLRRQNMLPDTSYLYGATSKKTNTVRGHRANLELHYSLDSVTELNVRGAFRGYQERAETRNLATNTANTGAVLHKADNSFDSRATGSNTDIDAFLGRRFGKDGRALTMTFGIGSVDRKTEAFNKGATLFYKADGTCLEDKIDQLSHADEKNKNLTLGVSYVEPLSKGLNLQVGYRYSQVKGVAVKVTNRFNENTGRYDLSDSLYTNAFEQNQYIHVPNGSISFNSEKFSASLGTGLQWLKQENGSVLAKNLFRKRYTNILPNTRFNLQLSKTTNISLDYNGRSEQPTMEQLQPVPDNNNMLYLKLGNPDLKPAFYHNFDLSFDRSQSRGYFTASVNLTLVQNKITGETWFDSVQITRPANTQGNYVITFHTGVGRTWSGEGWTFRYSAHNSGYFDRTLAYVNRRTNSVETFSINQRVGLTFTYKDRITLAPAYVISYAKTHYSLQAVQTPELITHTITVNALVNWPQRLGWETNLQHIYRSQVSGGFPKGVILWNAALSYRLFRQQQGVLRLSAYDLLRRNYSFNRYITATFMEDSQGNVLTRYFLLSFLYNLARLRK